MTSHTPIRLAVIAALGLACSSSDSGSPGSVEATGGGSATGSGGQSANTGGGGSAGGGGAPGTGGAGGTTFDASGASGSAGQGTGGAGGSTFSDAGGRDASTGSGGRAQEGGAVSEAGASAATPSAGCGRSGRPAGGVVTVANDHIYNFPASYDGSRPFPLLIGLHAASNPITQIQSLTNGSAFETNYVRAFPKSAGTAWDYNTDINKILSMYDDLLASYCIDTRRVFGTGHSSGAQMIVQILVHRDATQHLNFKGVAPVAASNYGALVGPVAAMYIQGAMDMVRMTNGADTVARFTAANSCSMTTMPYAGVPTCMSSGTTVNPGCVSYQSCTVPTVWCSHNDPQYSNTNHGWPCFATSAMYDFFAALP